MRLVQVGLSACLFLCISNMTCMAQLRGERPELIQVTDQVYSAVGYSLGNILYVLTHDSIVVIDTSESPDAAKASLAELRRISQLPISHIIYTHFHGDHINGARSFRSGENSSVAIIAQQEHDRELLMFQKLRPYNARLNAIQFGAALPKRDATLELALDPARPVIGYLRPTEKFESEYKFQQGGVQFELYHTQGETSDHLMVWLPESKVLFPGDLFYHSFPMLSSPMKHDRPVLHWAESLDRMRGLNPEHLVPSHTRPLKGAQHIETVLENYAAAIRFVHDETLSCINLGMSVEQARQAVRLPDHLSNLPYLSELYGKVAWSVNGIYRQYTGWYDMVPAHLNPAPVNSLHQAIAQAAGGAAPLYEQARKAHKQADYQLALELLTIALGAEPKHAPCHRLAAEVLSHLAQRSSNGVEKNVYLVAAQEHQQAAGDSVSSDADEP
ncbi:MAG TPA: hypothetical protein DCF63_04665 [Planctomycetaceae bacterium]|nr:hypothetical protein [Planctomycetaceae bacterium]